MAAPKKHLGFLVEMLLASTHKTLLYYIKVDKINLPYLHIFLNFADNVSKVTQKQNTFKIYLHQKQIGN